MTSAYDSDHLLDLSADGDRLVGGPGDDILIGGDGDDVIYGFGGNDTLGGSAGRDQLIGGAGADELDGGAGIDTAWYSTSSAGVAVDLAAGASHGGDAEGDRLSGIENIRGSHFADVLTGDAGANMLAGGDGDDIIRGGLGADWLVGGNGTDTVDYRGSGAGVTVDLAAGTGSGGDAAGDRLSGFEGLIGSDYADTIHDSAGNDVLTPGKGADHVTLSRGSDTVIFATPDDFHDPVSADLITFDGVDTVTLDFSRIDANPYEAGDQAFHDAGSGFPGGDPGAYFWDDDGTRAYLLFDIDGDGSADGLVELENLTPDLHINLIL